MSDPSSAPSPKSVNLADLKRKSVRGGMTTLVAQGIGMVIHFTSTVILARLLSPDDYGIMAMVMAVTAFAMLFRDLGLSSAAIQKQNLSHAQQSNLFWLNVGMGLLLTVLVATAAPLVAWFYQRPEVLWVTVALSIKFLIGSLGTQHGAHLVREMRFARQAVATISGSLVTLILSVALAMLGYSYWALVWGAIAGGTVTTTLLFVLSPFRPGLPSRGSGLRGMVKFGAHITAFDFVNYFHRNLDSVLIGRFWGTEALGLYSRAYALLMFPINAVRGPINAVAFPAMSKLQKDPAAFRSYYRKVTAIVALLSMPLCGFLFVAARPLIEVVLGARWLEAVILFQILAIVGFIQPSASLRGLVVMSLGDGRKYLVLGILQAVFTSIGFLIGIRWGAKGIAISYVISTYAVLVPMFYVAFKNTPLGVVDYLTSVARPFVASLTGVGAAAAANFYWVDQWLPLHAISLLLSVFCLSGFLTFIILPGGKNELSVVCNYLKMLLPMHPTGGSAVVPSTTRVL